MEAEFVRWPGLYRLGRLLGVFRRAEVRRLFILCGFVALGWIITSAISSVTAAAEAPALPMPPVVRASTDPVTTVLSCPPAGPGVLVTSLPAPVCPIAAQVRSVLTDLDSSAASAVRDLAGVGQVRLDSVPVVKILPELGGTEAHADVSSGQRLGAPPVTAAATESMSEPGMSTSPADSRLVRGSHAGPRARATAGVLPGLSLVSRARGAEPPAPSGPFHPFAPLPVDGVGVGCAAQVGSGGNARSWAAVHSQCPMPLSPLRCAWVPTGTAAAAVGLDADGPEVVPD